MVALSAVLGCGDTSKDGSGGSSGTAGSGALGGSGGGGAGSGGVGATDGGVDGGVDSGSAPACPEYDIATDLLPDPERFTPGNVGQIERDTLWRDDFGLHFAWNPWGIKASDIVAVLTTIDPTSGKMTHREFQDYWMGGVASSPDGIVALGVQHVEGWIPQGPVRSTGVLLIDQKDPTVQTYVQVYPKDRVVLSVGWDGEAFALHVAGAGLEVCRVSPQGDLLLTPTVFGVSHSVPGILGCPRTLPAESPTR